MILIKHLRSRFASIILHFWRRIKTAILENHCKIHVVYALLTQGIGCCSKVFSNKVWAGVCSWSLYKGYSYRSLGNLWDIRAPDEATACLRTGPRLRENKHYFSGVYLTFDFEGWDLVTLLCQTLCRHMAVNYLKVEGVHNVADKKY